MQSDVWALGIVLLGMLSGCVPWPSASPYEPGYADFVRDPHHLLDRFPITPGLNRILRRMLRVNPAIRMRLPEVREAIAGLEALLRDVPEKEADIGEEGVCAGYGPEEEKEKASGAAEAEVQTEQKPAPSENQRDEENEMVRSTVQSEMDIVAARQARREAIVQQHERACAAALGGSTLDFSPNTAAKAGRKRSGGSKGSSSGKSSTMVVTPGDSDVVIEKKDIGERMRQIVARMKFKFRSR